MTLTSLVLFAGALFVAAGTPGPSVAALEVSGSSGGGLVSVTLDGKGNLKGLKIDPSLFKEDDVEILEDLIVAAHKDAKDKAEAEAAEKTRALTAGLPIPPGFKLPF